MPYGEKILDHYNNPRNIGTLLKTDVDVGTGMVGAPECGDVMRLQIRVKDGIIVDPQSMPLISGSVVDYSDSLQGAGFQIKNPAAKTTCGCGSSFGT